MPPTAVATRKLLVNLLSSEFSALSGVIVLLSVEARSSEDLLIGRFSYCVSPVRSDVLTNSIGNFSLRVGRRVNTDAECLNANYPRPWYEYLLRLYRNSD